MYTKNGMKVANEEPLLLRSSNGQSPVSFRQSQDPAMNPTIRTANLIGPERFLKQSVAGEANSSNKTQKNHFNTMGRINSQMEKEHQGVRTMTGNNTPWTQPK